MRKQPNRPKRYHKDKRDYIALIKQGNVKAFYDSPIWDDLRTAALIRDHFECQRCGGQFKTPNDPIEFTTLSTATEVHHIHSVKGYPEMCMILSNLTCLCESCHNIVEERTVAYLHAKKAKPLTEEKW